MKIKYVNKNTIDVFCGLGWEQWTRFTLMKRHGKTFFHKVKGVSLSDSDMAALRGEIK